MHYLNTAYTVWSNKRNRRSGHLFEGPYKAIVMEDEGYLLTATGYVHMNPARVRGWRQKPVQERAQRIEEYPWSSYRFYVTAARSAEGLPQIECDRVWGELGAQTARTGRRQYRHYIRSWLIKEQKERQKPKRKQDQSVFNPFGETRLGCFLGSDSFRDFIQGLLGTDQELSEEIVGAKQWRRDIEFDRLLEVICQVLEVDRQHVKQRGRHHHKRNMAMYLCREAGERTLKEIGQAFGVKTAAAGHAVNRIKQRKREDSKLARSLSETRNQVIRKLET